MRLTKDHAAEMAKTDLSQRLELDVNDVEIAEVSERDFPDMSLGAPVDGEMSAQMISSGWQIRLKARDKRYEYRADKYQLRLHNFNGANYVIQS
ncbi:MAG: hypothetical protein ABR530_02520 [Pyrinomonadaceae bacterium]